MGLDELGLLLRFLRLDLLLLLRSGPQNILAQYTSLCRDTTIQSIQR